MKNALLAALLAGVIIFTGLLSGCVIIGGGGGGETVTRTFDFTGFTKIRFNDAFEYDITRADAYSISVNATERIADRLDVSQSGDTLTIELDGWFLGSFNRPEVTITMPELAELYVSGASQGTASGFESDDEFKLKLSGASVLDADMDTGNFNAELSGASSLAGDIEADDFTIKLSGASHTELSGSASGLNVEGSGASSVRLMNFPADDAEITLSGASHGEATISGRLDVKLSGASSLDYWGGPELGNIDISGASSIHNKEAEE